MSMNIETRRPSRAVRDRRNSDTSFLPVILLAVLCLMQAFTLCLGVIWELRYQDMQRALDGFRQGYGESFLTPEESPAELKARTERESRDFQKALNDAFAPFRKE